MDKSDQTLVDEITSGNPESFNELMLKYQQPVYQVTRTFAHNTEDALDLSQSVFLKAYENLTKFRGDSQFKTWLMRITYNESINWSRQNRKYKMQEELTENKIGADSSKSQEDMTLAAEDRTALLRCLYTLNTRYRLAVILRYFENYSLREIAETLNCSEGVVKSMLFRSLQKLRSMLVQTNSGVVS